MNYTDMRLLGIQLFPELETLIRAPDNCFSIILQSINIKKPLRDRFFDLESIPSEVAYKWAIVIGNKGIMLDHIKESLWALQWARYIGDTGTMALRITRVEDAREWISANLGYEIIVREVF